MNKPSYDTEHLVIRSYPEMENISPKKTLCLCDYIKFCINNEEISCKQCPLFKEREEYRKLLTNPTNIEEIILQIDTAFLLG